MRKADLIDCTALAKMWYEGWHQGHAAIVPAALVATRTIEEFESRVAARLGKTMVLEVEGEIAGFHMVYGDELYQFYVGAPFRGTHVAATLMVDVEQAMAGRKAWLACSVGNARAARFYEKRGWLRAGVEAYEVETASGPQVVDVWRYEKQM